MRVYLLNVENSSIDWRTLPGDIVSLGAWMVELCAGDRSFSFTSRTMPGAVIDSTSRALFPHDSEASLLAPPLNFSKNSTRDRTEDIVMSLDCQQYKLDFQFFKDLVDYDQTLVLTACCRPLALLLS